MGRPKGSRNLTQAVVGHLAQIEEVEARMERLREIYERSRSAGGMREVAVATLLDLALNGDAEMRFRAACKMSDLSMIGPQTHGGVRVVEDVQVALLTRLRRLAGEDRHALSAPQREVLEVSRNDVEAVEPASAE